MYVVFILLCFGFLSNTHTAWQAPVLDFANGAARHVTFTLQLMAGRTFLKTKLSFLENPVDGVANTQRLAPIVSKILQRDYLNPEDRTCAAHRFVYGQPGALGEASAGLFHLTSEGPTAYTIHCLFACDTPVCRAVTHGILRQHTAAVVARGVSQLIRICSVCHAREDKRETTPPEKRVSVGHCAGCHCVRYCGDTCQGIDWDGGHRSVCAQAAAALANYRAEFNSVD